MSQPKIEAIRDFQSFKIYINTLLHLEVRMKNHDGMQSWYEGSKKKMYFIEFYRKKGNSILMGYDIKETWQNILTLIDENI